MLLLKYFIFLNHLEPIFDFLSNKEFAEREFNFIHFDFYKKFKHFMKNSLSYLKLIVPNNSKGKYYPTKTEIYSTKITEIVIFLNETEKRN